MITAILLLTAICATTSDRVIYRASGPDGTILVTHRTVEAPPEMQHPISPEIRADESRLLRRHQYRFELEHPEKDQKQQLYTLEIDEFGPLFRVRPDVTIVGAKAEAGALVAVFLHDDKLSVLLARDGLRVAQESLSDECFPGPDIPNSVSIDGSPADDDLRVSLRVGNAFNDQVRAAQLHLIRTGERLRWEVITPAPQRVHDPQARE